MDVSVALRRAENLLRDTFQNVLSKSLGESWLEKSGISNERLNKWKERSLEDQKKRGQSDPRLIYYADFYDLKTIARKNWDNGISEIFGDLRDLESSIGILEDLRNPEAHRREFMPFEVDLASGISGRIRSKITRYFSLMDTGDSYYPRIEFGQDSLGNSYSIGKGRSVESKGTLRPGDEVQFKIVASDPLGEELEYLVVPNSLRSHALGRDGMTWNLTGEFSFEIAEDYVGRKFIFIASVRSKRKFHAQRDHFVGEIDDQIMFIYEVLPPQS